MHHINIVLADDHKVLRQGLKNLLDLDPEICVVGEASNGQEAVEQVSRLNPHIILMDIHMPILSGIEAAKIIKQDYPHTKIIVLTSYNDDKLIFDLIDVGIDSYLLKDMAAENIISAIKDVFQGQSILHPEVTRKVLQKMHTKQERNHSFDTLTGREVEVLKALVLGLSNKKIADKLYITQRTVQNHLSSIYNKLGLSGRAEAIVFAMENKFFEIN